MSSVADDDDALVAELRKHVQTHDPVPPDIATIAQMAFAMKDVDVAETIEPTVDDLEHAGARSSTAIAVRRASKGDASLLWRPAIDRLVNGIVEPAECQVKVATIEGAVPVDVNGATGSFEFAEPAVPWRIHVEPVDAEPWATQWQAASPGSDR